jgi:PHD/YefM family antitoxin component YafN of YafNO toxin-antitoxin module
MSPMFDKPATSVSHRTLKNQQARVFREQVSRGHTVAITNNNEIDGYLIPPAAYEDARRTIDELTRMKAAIPLIVAAARAGVAIPSETFETLGLELPFDWRALNDFQARFPVAMTHDEQGSPLPPPQTDLQQRRYEEEDDEELTLIE